MAGKQEAVVAERALPGRTASPANDNKFILQPSLDKAIAGQALTITQPRRKFGRCYAEFVGHAGDGKHVVVRKLIASTFRSRWSRPLTVQRSLVTAVHTTLARPELAAA